HPRGARSRREPAGRGDGGLRRRRSGRRLWRARGSAVVNFLERAIELAERGRGTTQPNPVVGAVLVRDGELVGEGWHERKGEAHAEVNALAEAGGRGRGWTHFVTLEPGAQSGTTPS